VSRRVGTKKPPKGLVLFPLTLPSVAVGLGLGLLGEEGDRGATALLADGEEDLGEGNFVFHNIYYHTQRGLTVDKKVKLFLTPFTLVHRSVAVGEQGRSKK
jgi:hypothetical protein